MKNQVEPSKDTATEHESPNQDEVMVDEEKEEEKRQIEEVIEKIREERKDNTRENSVGNCTP